MDRMEDAIAFTFITIGTLVRMALVIIFFQSIYGHMQTIGGWQPYQMYLLLGTWFFIDGIAWASYTRGFNGRLPHAIERGDFDLFLTKPVNLKIFLSYRFIDVIFTTPAIISAIGLIIYGSIISLEPIHIFSYLFFLAMAFWIHHSFSLILGTINFFHILEAPMYLRNSILHLGQYPITIYTGLIRVVFSFVIPLAFMFTIPAKAFLGKATIQEAVLLVLVGLFFYLFSSFFWKLGIHHYESANG